MTKFIYFLVFFFYSISLFTQNDLVKTITMESVPGAFDAQVLLQIQNVGNSANQNNPPFDFRLCFNNNGDNCLYNSNNLSGEARFENLASGDYCLYITDQHQCSLIECFTICPEKIFSEIKVTEPVQGPPTNLGIAEIITLPNINSPYFWNLENPGNYSQSGNNNPIKFLEPYPSPYNITVTDANGCTQTQSFVVKKCLPAVHDWKAEIRLIKPPQTKCSNTGELQCEIGTLATGVAPFTFSWSNTTGFKATTVDNVAPYTSNITGLTVGSYKVTITDYNCSTKVLGPFLLLAAGESSIIIPYTVSTGLGCSQYIDLKPIGGAAPYKVKWSNGALTEDIGPLLSNSNYAVTVTDKNGCSATKTIPTGAPKQLVVNAVMVAACGGLKGSLSATVTDGKAPYTYIWNTGASTPFIDNLGVASYTLTVTDANGCTKIKTFMVKESLVVSGTTVDACDGPGLNQKGSINTIIFGGTSPLTYTWNSGSTPANLYNLNPGNYTVTVTDSRGCTGSHTFTIYNTFSTYSDLAFQVNGIATIDGCALYGSCFDSPGQIISNTHTQFIYEPNDRYCPCHGGGTITCPTDNTLIIEVPAITDKDCEETLMANSPIPNCFTCYTYPFASPLVNTYVEDDIPEEALPQICESKFICRFAPGFLSNYWIEVETAGYTWCYYQGPGFNKNSGSRDDETTFVQSEVSLYPNPANDLMFVIFNSNENQNIQINMFDINGRKVLSTDQNALIGKNTIKVDISSIKNGGVYSVELWSGNTEIAKNKIVIVKE
jgi:Secretion system C-terminal sorting domain